MSTEATRANEAYYGEARPGVQDYWRKMAAPRFRVATLLAEIARLAPRSIADLGCGNGALLEEIHARFPAARIAGVDLSRWQIEANARRLPWAEWHAADLSRPDSLAAVEPFDVVTATELIEHLDEPAVLLESAARLLTRSGHLVLSTQSGRVGETERRVGHRRHFSARELRSMLEAAGFDEIRVWNAGFPFHDLSKWWANRDPDGSMSRFGDAPYGLRERAICAALRAAFRLNSGSRGAQLFAVARRR